MPHTRGHCEGPRSDRRHAACPQTSPPLQEHFLEHTAGLSLGRGHGVSHKALLQPGTNVMQRNVREQGQNKAMVSSSGRSNVATAQLRGLILGSGSRSTALVKVSLFQAAAKQVLS